MSLLDLIAKKDPYLGYVYAYPHKTAYRDLPPQDLRQVWANENTSQLFAYLHIPFCEMRCGFCNLLTTVYTSQDLTLAYLQALQRQIQALRNALPKAQFSRLALGGGTPTYLQPSELAWVFEALQTLGIQLQKTPTSVEVSPATVTPDKLAVLKTYQVDRISMGVQSFIESEVHSVGRAQKNTEVFEALTQIKASGFQVLNLDLIYGMAFQTPKTWLYSLETALQFAPEEIFLYPLYVRPLTGIGRKGKSWSDERQELYFIGRDFLRAAGYEQVSMRFFRKPQPPSPPLPAYRCQEDGMVGLGCGARSYTQNLHYSDRYAVSQKRVLDLIQAYAQKSQADFERVDYGFVLNEQVQKERYLLQSILHGSGLDTAQYYQRFQTQAVLDFPQLEELLALDFATLTEGLWRLTPLGMAWSDLIGPWLYNPAITESMESFALA